MCVSTNKHATIWKKKEIYRLLKSNNIHPIRFRREINKINGGRESRRQQLRSDQRRSSSKLFSVAPSATKAAALSASLTWTTQLVWWLSVPFALRVTTQPPHCWLNPSTFTRSALTKTAALLMLLASGSWSIGFFMSKSFYFLTCNFWLSIVYGYIKVYILNNPSQNSSSSPFCLISRSCCMLVMHVHKTVNLNTTSYKWVSSLLTRTHKTRIAICVHRHNFLKICFNGFMIASKYMTIRFDSTVFNQSIQTGKSNSTVKCAAKRL